MLLVGTQSACKEAPKEKKSADTSVVATPIAPEAFIKEFYAAYLAANLKMPIDYKQVDAIVDASCTPSLITYMDTAEMDFDPFLNAQDVFDAWQSHIQVKAHDSMPMCYWVQLDDPQNSNASAIILVQLKQQGNEWKIDKLLE
jgi:hypothetical protein